MKKSFKLFVAALMALTMFVPAQATETLTVCEGTNSSFYVPFKNTDFQNLGMHTQLIYPAEMVAVMNGEQINKVTFYLTSTLHAAGGRLIVKMGETDNPVYSYNGDFRGSLTQVAAMSLTEGVTELVVEFSTPYTYNGGNLVLDFFASEAGDNNFYAWDSFYGVRQDANYAIGSDGQLNDFLPKATFDYGSPEPYSAKVMPESLTFKTIHAEREDVQTVVLVNNGLNPFTPVIGALEAPFSTEAVGVELAAGASMEIPVKFAPAVEGEYTATLTIDCGEAGIIEVPMTATALEAVNEVVVCEGSSTNSRVPVYGLYYDTPGTTSQMIYPASMLTDLVGTKLTTLTFYPTKAIGFKGGRLELSLQVVDNNDFSETQLIEGMTLVADIVPLGNETELAFIFEEPFEYQGGNLAVECKVTEEGSYSTANFYGVATENNSSLSYYDWYGENTDAIKFLPMAKFGYEKEETQVETGDVNGDKTLDVQDVTALIDAVLSGDFSTINTEAADCNGDHDIDINDVTMLIDRVLLGYWQ